MIRVAEPDQPRFAHFEGVKVTSLYDLYSRHDEVARQIHQDTLRRFTGNNTLTVDLVHESPIVPDHPQETIQHLQQYEVVSVSSGVALGSIIRSGGVAGHQLVDMYRHSFAEQDMPVFVESAGNEGKTKQEIMPRVSDFARNSLVVGEANRGGGSPYVEEHSSRINPTLTSDTPFNRGERYQFYNVSPSLTGHEDLIRDWIIDREVNRAFDQFKQQNQDKVLDNTELSSAYLRISQATRHEYTETKEGQAKIDAEVRGYMARPETLHSQIMAEFREHADIDANGFVTGIDGTSFSAPEQAGYISGAVYEQTQREEQGRPILTKDEITTLAKMATIDTQAREGSAEPMHSYTNHAGETFVEGGGHGVFQPEMFRSLLNEAYRRIETDPNIDRHSVTAVMSAPVGDNHRGDQPVRLSSNLPEGHNMVIDRMRLDLTYRVDGLVPHTAVLTPPGQEAYGVHLQEASGDNSRISGWSREEDRFGEIHHPGDHWDVRLVNGRDSVLQDAQITVYGYNQGGLMDQMIAYSKELAAKMTPTPAAAPDQPAVQGTVAPANAGHDTPSLPPAPR